MAKKYLNLFRDSGETQYASGAMPIMSLAALNKGVKFSPVTPAKGDTANTVQFIIQRLKRVKAGAVAAKSGKAATDAIALLDTAQKVDWDSVDVMASAKRSLVINVSPFEELDVLEDATAYNGAIANRVKNRLMEAEELATAKILASAAVKADLDVTDIEKTADQIEKAIEAVELLVDDFKAYSDNVAVIVHPTIAKSFSKLQGQGYQAGTNTFPSGLGKSFTYEGYQFFVSPILNAVESSTGKVAGAIVMDMEAYANSGLENTVKTFDQELADERFIGHTYHELDAVIDAARIKVLEITITKGKLVNE